MTKTIERAHLPSQLWHKIKLSNNYAQALEQIDSQLIYWPKFLIHKCKQRLTRLRQVQIRARRLAAEEERLGEKLVPKLAPKIRDRESKRERKAEMAAKLERTIERELLERLRSGAYGEQPLNVSEAIWKKVLRAMERDGNAKRDKDMDKGIGEDEDEQIDDAEFASDGEEEDLEKGVVYVSGDEGEDSEEELDDIQDWLESDDEGEEDSEEDEDEDEDEEEEEEEETEVGKKRKRARAAKLSKERLKHRKLEQDKRPKLVEELAW